jgi:uncharacterized membrane protein YccC
MADPDENRDAVTPEDMERLRAELQQQHGMTPAQAGEAAAILGRLAENLERTAADVADMAETMDRLVASLEATTRPKH